MKIKSIALTLQIKLIRASTFRNKTYLSIWQSKCISIKPIFFWWVGMKLSSDYEILCWGTLRLSECSSASKFPTKKYPPTKYSIGNTYSRTTCPYYLIITLFVCRSLIHLLRMREVSRQVKNAISTVVRQRTPNNGTYYVVLLLACAILLLNIIIANSIIRSAQLRIHNTSMPTEKTYLLLWVQVVFNLIPWHTV